MKKRFYLVLTFILLVIFSIFVASAHHEKTSKLHKTTSPVQLLSDKSIVRGARSTLVRNNEKISMHINTNGLKLGTATTIWWVIFNHPEKCKHPEGKFRCGPKDLKIEGGDPAIKSSVLYAAGNVIRENGKGSYGAMLMVNDTKGALFGPGLTNPHGVDVHLIVRSHGSLIKGLVKEMISTFGAGCKNIPSGTGTQGPNTCEDLQFSVHETI